MAEISPLRRRMIEDMTVRNLSPATQQSYLNAKSPTLPRKLEQSNAGQRLLRTRPNYPAGKREDQRNTIQKRRLQHRKKAA